jgi:sugar lactone lactonase YvrE
MSKVRCVVPSQNELGETPLWCPRTNAVWWLDIERPKLQSFDPSTGRRRSFSFSCAFLGSLALRRSGGFLLALDLGLHAFDPATGELAHFCDVETARWNNRLNDGRCDTRGRFWVGTMDVGLKAPTGALYSVDAEKTVTRHEQGVIVSNSIALSPDQRTLYFSDTRRFTMWAFALDPELGVLSNRRVFVDHTATGDRPDGACVDEEGCVWVAMFTGSRIARYRPNGLLDRTIPVPVTNPTCVCFGGSDLSTLYITSARKFLSPAQLTAEPLAGALLAIEPGVRGIPEAQFAG